MIFISNYHILTASKTVFKVILESITHCKVKLTTLVAGDPKAPFSIATTPKCRGECFPFLSRTGKFYKVNDSVYYTLDSI